MKSNSIYLVPGTEEQKVADDLVRREGYVHCFYLQANDSIESKFATATDLLITPCLRHYSLP